METLWRNCTINSMWWQLVREEPNRCWFRHHFDLIIISGFAALWRILNQLQVHIQALYSTALWSSRLWKTKWIEDELINLYQIDRMLLLVRVSIWPLYQIDCVIVSHSNSTRKEIDTNMDTYLRKSYSPRNTCRSICLILAAKPVFSVAQPFFVFNLLFVLPEHCLSSLMNEY